MAGRVRRGGAGRAPSASSARPATRCADHRAAKIRPGAGPPSGGSRAAVACVARRLGAAAHRRPSSSALGAGRHGGGGTAVTTVEVGAEAALLQIRDQVEPVIPHELRSLIEGEVQVVVAFTVLPDGHVAEAAMLRSSHPEVNAAVLDAMRQWRYQPIAGGHAARGGTGAAAGRLRPRQPPALQHFERAVHAAARWSRSWPARHPPGASGGGDRGPPRPSSAGRCAVADGDGLRHVDAHQLGHLEAARASSRCRRRCLPGPVEQRAGEPAVGLRQRVGAREIEPS